MSTRSTVVINYGGTNVIFYRHHDGYVAVGGYELATLIKHHIQAPALIKDMMSRQRGIYIGDMDRPLYRLEAGLAGDSEYTYYLTYSGDYLAPRLSIKVVEHRYDADDLNIYAKSGACGAVAKDFFEYCNKAHMKAISESFSKAS